MTRLARVVMLLASLTLVPAGAAAQQADDLRSLLREVDALKEEQAKIRSELQVIRELLQGRGAAAPGQPQNLALPLGDDPVKGDQKAHLVLVDFADYQCPFCGRHVRETLPQLDREYIQTGKLRYVAREFPLEALHPQAFKAAEAALCAGEEGKYWEMHDRLFGNQRALGPSELPAHAQALGLDEVRFRQCLDSGRKADKVRRDLAEGQRAGIRGTPTFFLGITDEKGSSVKVLRVIHGAQPFVNFKAAIDSALAAKP